MKKVFISTFTIVLLTITGCGAQSDEAAETNDVDVQSQADTYETIELEEIDHYVADGYQLLDVREIEEYEEGHIPEAVNLPLSSLQANNFELDEDGRYVVICRSGNRSQMASQILIEDGYDVVNVREGMSTWQGEVVQ